MTELLRKALANAESLREVERETGVIRQSMMMFLKGKTITLENADKLAAHFGIECRARTPKKGR